MANPASHNEPSAEHVIEAVEAIEKLFNDLLVEKTTYMSKCKTIRKIMADRQQPRNLQEAPENQDQGTRPRAQDR